MADDQNLSGEKSLQAEVGFREKRGERGPIWWARRRIGSV